MLCSPNSEQMLRVSIFSPPFAAAYAETVSRPSSLIIEQILIIFPCPFFIIPGMTAFDTIKGALRSISITLRKSSTDISVIGIRLMIPALLTSMSMVPSSFSMSATIAFTCSSSVTSQIYPLASIPFAL